MSRVFESQYGQFTLELIQLFQSRVISEVRGTPFDSQAWNRRFLHIYGQMTRLEVKKYFNYKFSMGCQDLARILQTRTARTGSAPFQASRPRYRLNPSPPVSIEDRVRNIRQPRSNRGGYYTKIMNNVLHTPRTEKKSKEKVNEEEFVLDDKDFWLLDNNIQLIG